MRSPLGTDALEERLRHARDSASRSQGPQRVASALSGLDVLLELRQRGQRTRGAAIDFALATVAIDELRRSDQVEEAMQLTLSVRELAHESGDILALQLLDILAGELLCDCLEFVALERYWERTLGAPLTAQNGESALHRAMGVMSADANCRNRGVRSLARSFAVLGMFEDAQVVYEQLLQLQDGWDLLDASTVQLELLELHADAGHIEHGEALIATMDTSSPMVSLAVGGLKLRAGHLSEARVALRTALESLPVNSPAAAIAMELLVQCLAFLNRMGEVDDLLEGLDVRGSTTCLTGFRQLIAARRMELDAERWQTSAQEALVGERPTKEATAGRVLVDTRRRTSRLRADYARVAAAVMLAIDARDLESARTGLDALRAMSDTGQAEALRARTLVLGSLCHLVAGDSRNAVDDAEEALALYLGMQLRTDAWAAARVAVWAHAASDDLSQLSVARARAEALARSVLEVLSESDQALYQLNKWTQQDEQLSRLWRSEDEVVSLLTQTAALRGWRRPEGADLRAGHAVGNPAPDADLYATAIQWLHAQEPALPRTRESWVEAGLLDEATAIVCYVCLPDRVEIAWLARAGSGRLTTGHGSTRADVRARVGRALATLRKRGQYRPTGPLKRLSALLRMEDLLTALPAGITRLVLWADDVLLQTPWAALPLGDGEPLVLAFTPLLMSRLAWQRRPSIAGASVVATCGDGDADRGLAALSGVSGEADALERLLVDRGVTVLRDATKPQLVDALQQARQLHLACHGVFDSTSPLNSGLRLADGWWSVLAMGEVDFAHLNTVVISACWTGNAKILPGREPIGVSQTLLRRGARHVVASLFEVGDQSSGEFVTLFHQGLGSLDAPEALAQAQRLAIHQGFDACDWSPYICNASALTPHGRWNGLRLSWRLWRERRKRGGEAA